MEGASSPLSENVQFTLLISLEYVLRELLGNTDKFNKSTSLFNPFQKSDKTAGQKVAEMGWFLLDILSRTHNRLYFFHKYHYQFYCILYECYNCKLNSLQLCGYLYSCYIYHMTMLDCHH